MLPTGMLGNGWYWYIDFAQTWGRRCSGTGGCANAIAANHELTRGGMFLTERFNFAAC